MNISEMDREQKRAAGFCTVTGCEEKGGHLLGRCRAHAGVFAGASPLPAQPHRSLQVSGWRNAWEG